MRRLIVGLTGATGAILGVRLLEALNDSEVESHLVISNWARRTIEHETPYTVKQVCELAKVCHNSNNMAAEISSGSFITEAASQMVMANTLFIAPPMLFSKNGGDWCSSRANRHCPNCISKTC